MEQYNPDEFTLSEYDRIINLAKNNFVFKKYQDIDIKDSTDKVVIWRHDVDYTLDQSLVLAKIEYEHKVQSTFFLHLHNDFYNLFDFHSLNLVKEILSYKHSIGLHFDLSYYKIHSVKDLEFWLSFEKNILEKCFNTKIYAFSFHNPNELSSSFDAEDYSGMINCYSQFYKNKFSYCSDSNGYWRFRKLSEVLSDSQINRLQVLTHPGWWTDEKIFPRDKIMRIAKIKLARTMLNYDSTLENSGRINIGKILLDN